MNLSPKKQCSHPTMLTPCIVMTALNEKCLAELFKLLVKGSRLVVQSLTWILDFGKFNWSSFYELRYHYYNRLHGTEKFTQKINSNFNVLFEPLWKNLLYAKSIKVSPSWIGRQYLCEKICLHQLTTM